MTTYRSCADVPQCDVLILPFMQDESGEVLYSEEYASLVSLPASSDFKGDRGQTLLLFTEDTMVPRMLLVGCGKQQACTLRIWKQVIGTAIIAAQSKKYETCAVFIPSVSTVLGSVKTLGTETVIGIEMAAYSFDTFKESSAAVFPITQCHLVIPFTGSQKTAFQKGIEEGIQMSEGVLLTRHLGNTPPRVMTPSFLASTAKDIASHDKQHMKLTVYDRDDVEKMGMGCFLGVAQGSTLDPKFIVLEYTGTDKKKAPTVLVGKGITFDSGGLSLKPADYMVNMKFDMLGAGTVLGIMKAVSNLQLKKNVVAIIPSCENMPSGTAFRPDDILTAMNGKTVEIQNTDAEGRLILADALSYAVKHYRHAKEVIDFATLTGACVVALGNERSGLFTPEQALADALIQSSEQIGEQLWRLPVGEEYSEAIKSLVADIKNTGGVGGERYAGASTAAAFLQYFTKDHESKEKKAAFPWAHIDLSCSYYSGKGHAWIRHGANGFGVQTIVQYLRG